jgi:hypothetical protein
MTTKTYKLSIPDEYESVIAALAKKAGMRPTSYLTSIIEAAIGIETRPVGNPILDEINNERKQQKMERILAENPDAFVIDGWYTDIENLPTYNGLFTPDWDNMPP